MGASKSKNVQNMAIDAVTDVTNDITSDSSAVSEIVQAMEVDNVVGDVDISGIRQSAENTVSMTAIQDAFSSAKAQQDLAQTMSQAAKAMTSGINLLQSSKSINEMNSLIEANISLASNISQFCSASAMTLQNVRVSTVQGNVTISDVEQKAVSGAFASCTQNAVNASSATQKVTTLSDQTATATTEGISEWALALMAALGSVRPYVPHSRTRRSSSRGGRHSRKTHGNYHTLSPGLNGDHYWYCLSSLGLQTGAKEGNHERLPF